MALEFIGLVLTHMPVINHPNAIAHLQILTTMRFLSEGPYQKRLGNDITIIQKSFSFFQLPQNYKLSFKTYLERNYNFAIYIQNFCFQ